MLAKYYIYKDKYYKTHGVVEMKCTKTNKWVKAVRYRQLLTGCELNFVRELNDFCEKFKRCDREDLVGK